MNRLQQDEQERKLGIQLFKTETETDKTQLYHLKGKCGPYFDFYFADTG